MYAACCIYTYYDNVSYNPLSVGSAGWLSVLAAQTCSICVGKQFDPN